MTENILNNVSNTLMTAITLICGIIGIKHRNKFPELKLLFIYPFVSFLQTVFSNFIISLKLDIVTENAWIQVSQNIFLPLEMLFIYNFFARVLHKSTFNKLIYFFIFLYIATIAFTWIFMRGLSFVAYNLFIAQAIFVLIPVFIYFIDLFRKPAISDLFSEPSFWIASGLAFYFACTLPMFLIKDFMVSKLGGVYELGLYSINYFCYSTLFLLIIKAYLCRKKETR